MAGESWVAWIVSPRYRSIDWYDLPRYYEAVFSPETRVEADFVERLTERYGRSPTNDVLEPACGSGRLVVELARRGYSVTGFDANDQMLRYAQQRLSAQGLRADLARGDLQVFQLKGRFDAALCLVSTFKYILDERGARSHLAAVAKHLRPGGLYVLGFHLTEYESRARTRERWTAALGRSQLVCNIQIWPADKRKRLERVRSRLRIITGDTEKRFETNWLFRTYDARQVRRLMRTVPDLEHVATHDFTYDIERQIPLNGEQLDVVVVLRKRRQGRSSTARATMAEVGH